MKRKHFYCLSTHNCQLALLKHWGNILMGSVALCLLKFFLEYSEDGVCSFLCALKRCQLYPVPRVVTQERGNSCMLEFAQLYAERYYTFWSSKRLMEYYCHNLTFWYCIPIIDASFKNKQRVCAEIRTNTDNYLSLIIEDPTTDKHSQQANVGNRWTRESRKSTENKITETHMTIINDR